MAQFRDDAGHRLVAARRKDSVRATLGATLIGAKLKRQPGQPYLSPLRGSEFARSSRKFRVRGLSASLSFVERHLHPQRVRPCGEAPSPRPSPRKRGEGAERPANKIDPRVKPAGDGQSGPIEFIGTRSIRRKSAFRLDFAI